MKSVMKRSFANTPRADIPRSSFDRSHGVKTTFDADYLIPVLVDDIIPGDTFNVNMSFVCRLTSPTVVNLLDNLHFESFFFFVPYRLLWINWEKFCGAQDDPGDSISYTIPVCTGTNSSTGEGSLWDYFGLPLSNQSAAHIDPDDLSTSCLPYRAYALIWDEWFRDQNLQDAVWVDGVFGTNYGGDGPDQLDPTPPYSVLPANPLKRGKRHDYFTASLPWPQKGTAVTITTTEQPVTTDLAIGGTPVVYSTDTSDYQAIDADVALANISTSTGLEANRLFTEASATINDLRLAFQTQRLLERDARSGTRYVETILAHYGVTVPDFRVQRPEFLGGGSSRINITPVAQTTYQGTQTVEDAKGAMAGIGQANGTHGFTKSFVEHGVLIGLVNVRGDITYSQGQERYWAKSTRYDFYYPVLAQIGEQSVLMKEIWAQGDGSTTDETVWGYQERYAEYRYKPSRLTGLMSVDAASNLDEFHLSEDFATQPSLDSTFIESNTGTPLDRAISVPSQPQFIADFYFDMKCARPMPLYGVPGNLDHF